MHDIKLHNDVLAEVDAVVTVALGDELVGAIREVTIVLVPRSPPLSIERVTVLHEKLKAVGRETQLHQVDVTLVVQRDASAPCAHLVLAIETHLQVAIVVEILAQSEHIDATLHNVLGNLLRSLGTRSVRVEIDSCKFLGKTVHIERAHLEGGLHGGLR